MSTPMLSLLRRRQQLRIITSSILYSSHSSPIKPHHFVHNSSRNLTTNTFFTYSSPSPHLNANNPSLTHQNLFHFRYFSTHNESEFVGDSPPSEFLEPEFSTTSLNDGDVDIQEVVLPADIVGVGNNDEYILPVCSLIWLLDGFHGLTGLPWWIIIASSTLAMRVALLPILILQLHKVKRIADLLPTLPPPLPPPLSGRSYKEQYKLFRNEQNAIGCPSFLWMLAYISIQIPCFLLWMTSIRRMSMDHHPGFDCGGTLWFQNLTELSHGVFGSFLPLLITGLHLINVQVSFGTSSVGKMSGPLGTLAKYYKFYLQALTVPILFAGFCIPQGSLVFWITNSSLTLIQQLTLGNQHVRKKLGLPDKVSPVKAGNSREAEARGITSSSPSTSRVNIHVEDLSPLELVNLSIQHLAKGQKDRAIPLLRLALDKDFEYVKALIIMGQILVQDGLLAEATEYFERAIAKLVLEGHPTEGEDVDHLILASTWAGVAFVRQGKIAEGILHLERIASLKEPEDQKSKTHYCEGLLMLASTLLNEGRNDEAAKYVRILAGYNPAYSAYLKDCEDNFADNLVNSRRKDY